MNNKLICKGKYDLSSITPTICELMDVQKPVISSDKTITEILEKSKEILKSKIDKCLVFAPDAIGSLFYNKYKSKFKPVEDYSTLSLELCSIFPPKTPVCFASMFTGAQPDIHGIKEYEKPVLSCDTIFDAFIRNGKKVAIVAVENSSIDMIFRNRNMDYFSETNDSEVAGKTVDLLENDSYDLIVVYQQEYDDFLHKTHHESKEALNAIDNHVRHFEYITKSIEKNWSNFNRFVLFTPDHGAHFDEEKNIGFHGRNIPLDMLVRHFFTIKTTK